jgi:rRNA maturation protein Nop10
LLVEVLRVRNGDQFMNYPIYKCDDCETEIECAWPHERVGDCHYCVSCSFIRGLIDENQYLRMAGIDGARRIRAGVHEGKIHHWFTDKPPWEMSTKELRRSPQYVRWRKQVLERDGHKCTKCGSEENLHAHHIKPFAKYEKQRFKLSNGLTLCKDCHTKVHSKKNKGE